jgi:hypothetical protein
MLLYLHLHLHLHQSIGVRSFHLHWVLHLLTHDLRENRKEYAKTMFFFLHAAERDSWYHLVTGDESWFFLNILSCRIWTLSRDDMITRPRHDVQRIKCIFTMIWNSSSFYIVDRLSNNSKMNNDYFITSIPIPLEQAIFPRGRAPHQKRLVVHLDNCSIYTNRTSTDWLEEHGIRRMPHSPYSPDLAPSDFYLFPAVKNSNGFRWLTKTVI